MTAKESLQLIDLPQSSVGAPLPQVFADEHRLLIGYVLQVQNRDCDRSPALLPGAHSGAEACALVTVDDYWVFQFGPPNDEAIEGHRLYRLGLAAYSSFEVLNSKWIAECEIANRVHEHHRSQHFSRYRHIILTFHDSTLEFIASSFTVRTFRGSILDAVLLHCRIGDS